MATLNDIISTVDELKPNQYSDQTKIDWINTVEYRVIDDIINTHKKKEDTEDATDDEEDEEDEPLVIDTDTFDGYTEEMMDYILLVPDAFKNVYIYYLSAMIDYFNGETDRYMNSMIMFNSAFGDFFRYYNRNNMPLSTELKV